MCVVMKSLTDSWSFASTMFNFLEKKWSVYKSRLAFLLDNFFLNVVILSAFCFD